MITNIRNNLSSLKDKLLSGFSSSAEDLKKSKIRVELLNSARDAFSGGAQDGPTSHFIIETAGFSGTEETPDSRAEHILSKLKGVVKKEGSSAGLKQLGVMSKHYGPERKGGIPVHLKAKIEEYNHKESSTLSEGETSTFDQSFMDSLDALLLEQFERGWEGRVADELAALKSFPERYPEFFTHAQGEEPFYVAADKVFQVHADRIYELENYKLKEPGFYDSLNQSGHS